MSRIYKKLLFTAIILSITFIYPAANAYSSDEQTANVYHIVICWLKNPGDSLQRQKLIDETKKFQAIPGLLSVKVGTMLPSTRPIVDSSYDIAIIMSFTDENSMHRYLQEPAHQKATKEILVPLTSKVVVYDFVVAK